jgi:hypothetical protein
MRNRSREVRTGTRMHIEVEKILAGCLQGDSRKILRDSQVIALQSLLHGLELIEETRGTGIGY